MRHRSYYTAKERARQRQLELQQILGGEAKPGVVSEAAATAICIGLAVILALCWFGPEIYGWCCGLMGS